MFLNISIVLLVTSVVAMCAGNRLPDMPQTAPSGISHPDTEIMAVVEQLKSEIMNIKASYDGKLRNMETRYDEMKSNHDERKSNHDEMKSNYDEMKTNHDEMKSNHDEMKSNHDEMKTNYDEMKSNYDEMKTNYDEMKSNYDAEMMALKESYTVLLNKNERQEIKYDLLIKGYASEANREKIGTRINQADVAIDPNDIHKDQVDGSKNNSQLKVDLKNENASPQLKSDPSVDSAKGSNNNENPAPTTNPNSEQLKQLLDVSGYNPIDISDNGLNTNKGKAVGFSAFQVYMSADYLGNPDDILVYDDVQINIGGVYDAATGHITAPTTGVYVINRSHMADPSCGTSYTCTSLRVNGVHISYTCSEWVISTAKTELVQLVAGDEVWLQTSGSCYSFDGGNHNSFSGYLLVQNI